MLIWTEYLNFDLNEDETHRIINVSKPNFVYKKSRVIRNVHYLLSFTKVLICFLLVMA